MVLHATGMGYDIIIYLRNNLWHCTVTASLILLLVENVAYYVVGIPLPFVAIGLGSVHNQYGVKDSSGELQ